ncbi:MAG TPA: hypothetical protein VMH40_17145 [Myxococcaceae bacterium]|nr:hypothetical protein [Myxococcaceae bacterium]
MRGPRSPALLAALLVLGTGVARAAPRPTDPRLRLPLRVASRISARQLLRPLPEETEPVERPGAYAQVTRWISDVAVPGPDGKPKLVVVTVRGGLGLGWARRW